MDLADLLTFVIMLGMIGFAFSIMSAGLDNALPNCEENITTVGCEFLGEGTLVGTIGIKTMLLIGMLIPMFMLFGRFFTRIFGGILSGIFEFAEGLTVSSNDNNDDDNNEEEEYLKDTKSKLKKELNRKSSESNNQSESKGVQWGSGVELGKGMNDYEK